MIDVLNRAIRKQARSFAPRRYLMCRPDYFEVVYSINPWMDPQRSSSTALALEQWSVLHDTLIGLGHNVELIEPVPGLPDMVFAANGATVIGGKALSARFRYEQRAPEGDAYLGWLRESGYSVCQARFTNEGEGDYLFAGKRILGAHGFRTHVQSHVEAEDYFGAEVVGLTLVDPRFYHLDTALCILAEEEIMYYPDAFSPASRDLLRELYPDAITATHASADAFGMNAISDGLNVILPGGAPSLPDTLRAEGFKPINVDMSELLKAGGGAKCCVLELRGAAPSA